MGTRQSNVLAPMGTHVASCEQLRCDPSFPPLYLCACVPRSSGGLRREHRSNLSEGPEWLQGLSTHRVWRLCLPHQIKVTRMDGFVLINCMMVCVQNPARSIESQFSPVYVNEERLVPLPHKSN